MMKQLPMFVMLLAIPSLDAAAQSKEAAIEDLKWVAVVSPAEATFTFPPTKQEKWAWYQAETSDDMLEYCWNITVGDKSVYEFGPTLFKPGGATPMAGSLADLLQACQHDLWTVSEDGGENIGEYGEAKAKNGKVHVRITDDSLLKKLFEAKPNTVYMTIDTPGFYLRKKVSVTYEK